MSSGVIRIRRARQHKLNHPKRKMVVRDDATRRSTLSVLPGMTGTVEIGTGQPTVFGFVLRPMLKSLEAFRER